MSKEKVDNKPKIPWYKKLFYLSPKKQEQKYIKKVDTKELTDDELLKNLTLEGRQYVINNYKSKTSEGLAVDLGITKYQVFVIICDIRSGILEQILKAKQSNDFEKANELKEYIIDIFGEEILENKIP